MGRLSLMSNCKNLNNTETKFDTMYQKIQNLILKKNLKCNS